MSYNPTRANFNGTKPLRQRIVERGAGKRHSDIIAGQGSSGLHYSDYSAKTPTKRGWKVSHFEGEAFEVVYELICSRNTTGVIVNHIHDRCIRVLSGTLYICIDSQKVVRLDSGQACSLPKGTKYEMSSMGDHDVEVLFCQGNGYESTVEQVSGEESLNSVTKINFVVPLDHVRDQRLPSDKAIMAAEKIKNQRERKARINSDPNAVETRKEVIQRREAALQAQVTSGVNLRPLGPGGLGAGDVE